MTKEEKDQLIAKIKAEFGEAEYDFGTPVNESAKRQSTVINEFRLQRARESRAEAKEKEQTPELKALAEETFKDKHIDKKRQLIPLPLFCTESDMAPFTDLERKIIDLKLRNYNLKDDELAKKLSCKYQTVTALFRQAAYKLLIAKLHKELLPMEAWTNLREHMRTDSKINMRVAEHFGLISPEKKEIDVNKPIDDPKALKMLKELGDKIINDNVINEALDNKDKE